MNNAVIKWALQLLQQSPSTFVDNVDISVSNALKLVDIKADDIQVNSQPLESIFSAIALDGQHLSNKKIVWQELDAQQIVYPKEHAAVVPFEIPEPPGGWDRFYANDSLALALIEKYGTFLSISPQVPHISFYDVVKSAAAIHDCLECETDTPFLLVSGDFSGIQDAIYAIDSSGALKTLRARSFMLELLTEHIIYEIQQATCCGRYSLIFSGGGGFSLLIPNTENNQNAINDFAKVINAWTLEQFRLQLFLALHCEPVSADAIEGSQFKNTWELMANKLGKQKQRKFWNSDNFEDMFKPKMPLQLENQSACQITHRDDLPEAEMIFSSEIEGRVSRLAYRLWKLGDRLTEIKSVVRLKETKDDIHNGTLLFPTHQSETNSFQYAEYKVVKQIPQRSEYDVCWVVNSWDLNNYDERTYPLLYGDYVRSVADLPCEAQELEKEEYKIDRNGEMDEPAGVTASFSGLAKAAQGSELIGCLRMDMDDSGDLFSDKLASSGIAALSNFSQNMNLFFKGYLNQICGMKLGVDFPNEDHPLDITGKKEDKKTQGRDVSIVYAGGDDMFIVGAWDDIAELAFDINACFQAFTCQNPDVNLSAGVTLHKPKFPLYQMARIAAEAEHNAKANKWDIDKEKNSLSLFYSSELKTRNILLNKRIEDEFYRHGWQQKSDRIAIASEWSEFADVIKLTQQLYEIYEELPQGFYRRLFETLQIWQEDGKLYMPMLTQIIRKIDELNLKKPISKDLKMLLFKHIQQLHIPLYWVEYLNR